MLLGMVICAWGGVLGSVLGFSAYGSTSFFTFCSHEGAVYVSLQKEMVEIYQAMTPRFGMRDGGYPMDSAPPWPNYDGFFFTIRYWFIALIATPMWWILHRKWARQRQWAREGRCASCGYDLTGNESGVCSECGCGVRLTTTRLDIR